ncbi:MAG TPA: hypothetical protein VF950_13970 [Planctomycetota bacterium]
MRPSRAFLLVGALLCATLPFSERLVESGLAGFLKTFARDERIWRTATRLVFFLALGATAWMPATRAGAGWVFAAVVLYVYAALGCFLAVFSGRDPLFDERPPGMSIFLLLLPALGGFHLASLVLREFPWWLVGFWARVELAGLIVLAGGLRLAEGVRIDGGMAVAAGVFLIAGEVLARREEAFEEAPE